ncbi:MAG: hypothetical protein IPP22_10345 [Nitrosomonas sp.]|nr:hypothetical protein [Nitrosomonas sp.]
MLWLPMQGAAAAVLSVCAEKKSLNNHHDKKLAITNDDHHHAACHKQETETLLDHVLSSVACDDTTCDAYSNTPIVANYVASMPANKIPVVFALKSGLISFIPEQLQRPPLYFSL